MAMHATEEIEMATKRKDLEIEKLEERIAPSFLNLGSLLPSLGAGLGADVYADANANAGVYASPDGVGVDAGLCLSLDANVNAGGGAG
jgi:hypothetical protein